VAGALVLIAGLAGRAQNSTVREAPVDKSEAPLVFYTGSGQFEIIAVKPQAAQDTLILANSVWRSLARPIGLPAEGFSSAVAVRLVPEANWTEPAIFNVVAEPGGLVGVRICWGDKTDARIIRRALVQAVLLRQAVALHGTAQRLTVPLWLEQACVALGEGRDRPAMLDAMRQESAQLAPPPLETLLRWERGEPEERGRVLAAFWLFQHLQAESGDTPRWSRWLRALLGGADPVQAIQEIYGGAWKDPAARELWWRTGFYDVRTSSTLPLMSMLETRDWLADRCRWLAVKNGREQVLSFDDLWAERKEPWVKTGMTERAQQIENQLLRLHPFYRNAAISLGRMYQAAVKGAEEEFKAAKQAVSQDAKDGQELEAAATESLDALEAKSR
jgi:hypothetical protein